MTVELITELAAECLTGEEWNSADTLDKGMIHVKGKIHIPGETEQDGMRVHCVTQHGTNLKHEMFISEIFHLILSCLGWLGVTNCAKWNHR